MKVVGERILSPELETAKRLLEEALGILDDQGEAAAACLTCAAIDKLVGAPSALKQWLGLAGSGKLDPADTGH
ncbi:hypothetical protein WBP07_22570 (plasmid) [Novosphingobium sp. BL-8A]|uniref:hypothetical protein n=1 Tax=Novosphingobium sp. BL-8A TaxID=3127639 RepID=UPI0037574045